MQVDSFDPAAMSPPQQSTTLQPVYSQSTGFTGALRRDGDVTVSGDLTLTQALVFVRGNLNITGSVTGEGILVATGDLTIGGQARMTSANRVALLSKGKITLAGNGPASSDLRGLVYAENGLSTQQLSVQGAVVARNPQKVEMVDTSLLGDGALLQAPFDILRVQPTPNPPYVVGNGLTAPEGSSSLVDIVAAAQQAPGASAASYELTSFQVTSSPDGTMGISIVTTTFESGGSSTAQPVILNGLSPEDLTLVLTTGRPAGTGLPALPGLGIKPQQLPSFDPAGSGPGGGPGAGIFQLSADPSQLLPLEDRARILLWRED
jgi:cytoskeletal protein CcmA (bactofilin family)